MVVVEFQAVSILLDRAEQLFMAVGDTATPMATAVDRAGDAASIEWASDDTMVVTGGPGGRVMAVSNRTTSISATSGAVSARGLRITGSASSR